MPAAPWGRLREGARGRPESVNFLWRGGGLIRGSERMERWRRAGSVQSEPPRDEGEVVY